MVKRFETRSRPCPAKYIGQRIAIHAAAKPPAGLLSAIDVGDYRIRRVPLGSDVIDCRAERIDPRTKRTDARTIPLPLGAVVATAVITASLPIVEWAGCTWNKLPIVEWAGCTWNKAHVCHGATGNLTHHEALLSDRLDGGDTEHDISDQLPYGDWTPGRWAWQLDDVDVLPEPIPATGRQGWWTVELP